MVEDGIVRFSWIQPRLDQRDPRGFHAKVDQTVKRAVAINVATVEEYRP